MCDKAATEAKLRALQNHAAILDTKIPQLEHDISICASTVWDATAAKQAAANDLDAATTAYEDRHAELEKEFKRNGGWFKLAKLKEVTGEAARDKALRDHMQQQRDEREKGKRQRKDEKEKEKERNQVKKKLSS